MSGLEIVGAIAGVAQLGQYSARLIVCLRDLSKNIDRSATSFVKYRQQLDDTQQVAEIIRDSEGVDSAALLPLIKALLETAETLQRLLAKRFVDDPSSSTKKWRNRLKGIRFPEAEATIAKGFGDLERHKSTLTLCILANLGGLIQRIDSRLESGIPDLQDQVGKMERSLRACSSIKDDIQRLRRKGSWLSEPQAKSEDMFSEEKKLAIIGARAISSGDCYGGSECDDNEGATIACLSARSTYSENPAELQATERNDDSDTQLQSVHDETRLYANNQASESATQVNGNVGSQKPEERCISYAHWSRNIAGDQSRQINGDVLDSNVASLFFARG